MRLFIFKVIIFIGVKLILNLSACRCCIFAAAKEEELTRIVRFACTAASLSTQKHGGITSVPDKQEVIDRLDL